MRKIDIVSGAFIVSELVSGCRPPDFGQAYVNWTTQIKPTVECNRQGYPTINVGFTTSASNAEKVILKATSDVSGRSAEQELTQKDIKNNKITGSTNFRLYKYNLRGQKEEVPIQRGDIVTLSAFGIDRVDEGEAELIHVRPLTAAIKIEVECPPARRE
jgi:hypothetical protein